MPVLKVIAGPNGSGKSTLIGMLISQGMAFGEYLNADDIARDLIGTPEDVAAQAQQIVRDRRQAALAEGRDHGFETVMSHHSHIDYMMAARDAGFEVRLYFVATEDPVINLDRVASRVLRGGHTVPDDRVVARYRRCLEQLPDAIKAAHFCRIFDNSSTEQPMRELAILEQDSLNRYSIRHREIARSYNRINADDVPVWWLEILRSLKPVDTLIDGFIA